MVIHMYVCVCILCYVAVAYVRVDDACKLDCVNLLINFFYVTISAFLAMREI